MFSIALKDTAKNESTSGRPSLPTGKTNPTHRLLLGSYSTLEMIRVASSPMLTHVDELCSSICSSNLSNWKLLHAS